MRPRGYFFSTCVFVVFASPSGLCPQEPPAPKDARGNAGSPAAPQAGGSPDDGAAAGRGGAALVLSGFSPAEVSFLGHTPFEIQGQGFTPQTTVGLWSSSHAGSSLFVTYVSPTRLTGIAFGEKSLMSGPGTDSADLEAFDPVNGSATLPGAFDYVSPLEVSGVDPPVVAAGAGGQVTVTGVGFTPDTAVTIGGVPLAGKTFVNARTITGAAPPLPEGPYDLAVSDKLYLTEGPITFDDALPGAVTYETQAEILIVIEDVSVEEGDSATTLAVFTVRFSAPPPAAVWVDFTLVAGTATAGSDFIPVSGTLTFTPPAMEQWILVEVIGDTTSEPDEVFHVRLANARGATIALSEATGLIVNDDETQQVGDLVLAQVTLKPSVVVASEPVTVTAAIRNAGPALFRAVPVRFDAGGVPFDTQVIESVAPWGAAVVTTARDFDRTGPVTITATVNPDSAFPELDFTNNAASSSVLVVLEEMPPHGKPDIWLSLAQVSPERPTAGSRVTFSLQLGSLRRRPVPGPVHVELRVDGVLRGSSRFEGLEAGEVVPLSLSWDRATAGRHAVTVVARPEESLAEVDPGNNRVEVWLRVSGEARPLPDVEVGGIEVGGGQATAGQAAEISFDVTNEGYAAARDLPILVKVDGVELSSAVIPSLAGGEARTLSFTWADVAEGQHVISAWVDPGDTVEDRSLQPVWSHEVVIPGAQYEVPGSAGSLDWQFLGPRSLASGNEVHSGRIDSLAVPHPNLIYLGAPAGGVWVTRDAGKTWDPKGDHLPAPDFYAVGVDPKDGFIVYGSSSEGIFKSLDAGDHWSTFAPGSWFGGQAGRLVLRYENPSEPAVVTLYAGMGSGLWVWQGDPASDRSAQGDWVRAWFQTVPGRAGGVSEILFTLESPPRLYISVHNDSVYRIDHATLLANLGSQPQTRWTRLDAGLPADAGAILLGSSPAKPSLIYAGITRRVEAQVKAGQDIQSACGAVKNADAKQCGVTEVYVRDAGDTSWQCAGQPTQKGACGINYLAFTKVHSKDPQKLFIGGVRGWRSTDGGKSWSLIPYVHDDYKAMVFDPFDPTVSFITSDGGIYRCTGDAQSCTGLNDDLEVTQFFDLALSRFNPALMIGGTQDNGTLRYDAPNLRWREIRGGDGRYCAIDPDDPDKLFSQHQHAISTLVATDGGRSNEWSPANSGLPKEFYGDCPLVMHPGDKQKLLITAETVFRTTTGGTQWTSIGPSDLPSGEEVVRLAIDSLKGRYYAGTTRGRILGAEEKAPSSWSVIYTDGPPGPLERRTAGILVNPGDPERLYATFDGSGSWRIVRLDHVVGGWPGTWSVADLTGDFPGNRRLDGWEKVRGLLKDPGANVLYVGTDRGVYRGQPVDGVWRWFPYNCGLPLTLVTDLELETSSIVAGTFGRGAYRRTLSSLALLGPDAKESPVRNDVLANASWLGVAAAGMLKPGLDVGGLNLDSPGDVDFFSFQLPAADDCLSESDPRFNASVIQGKLIIVVHSPEAPAPFELRLYRGGQVLREYSGKSSLTYELECPRASFADGRITFSVRCPMSCLPRYDLWIWYRGWIQPTGDPKLNYDPPLRRLVPELGDFPWLFPSDPRAIESGYLGRGGEPFPEEGTVFQWKGGSDFLATIGIEGAGDLQAALYDAAGRAIARAAPARAPGEGAGGGQGGGGSAKVLSAPGLPAGWYMLGVKGGAFPTYFEVAVGGTPGEARFRRGDANDDRRVDLSDSVAVLNYLFLGSARPPCLEAANANDDLRLDLSDAVFILGFLFLGQDVPPAPGPRDCGPDATPPGLAPCDDEACG